MKQAPSCRVLHNFDYISIYFKFRSFSSSWRSSHHEAGLQLTYGQNLVEQCRTSIILDCCNHTFGGVMLVAQLAFPTWRPVGPAPPFLSRSCRKTMHSSGATLFSWTAFRGEEHSPLQSQEAWRPATPPTSCKSSLIFYHTQVAFSRFFHAKRSQSDRSFRKASPAPPLPGPRPTRSSGSPAPTPGNPHLDPVSRGSPETSSSNIHSFLVGTGFPGWSDLRLKHLLWSAFASCARPWLPLQSPCTSCAAANWAGGNCDLPQTNLLSLRREGQTYVYCIQYMGFTRVLVLGKT